MSKTRKTLTICLIVAVITLIIQLVIPMIGHEPLNIPVLVCTGIVPVVLISSILSTIWLSKKNDGNKK